MQLAASVQSKDASSRELQILKSTCSQQSNELEAVQVELAASHRATDSVEAQNAKLTLVSLLTCKLPEPRR